MSTSDDNPMGSHAVSAFANFANKYEKGTGGTTRYIARKLILMSLPFTDDSKCWITPLEQELWSRKSREVYRVAESRFQSLRVHEYTGRSASSHTMQ